VVIDLI